MFLENSSKTSKLSQKLESSIANAKSLLSFMPDLSNKMTRLLKQSEGMLHQLSWWREEDHKEAASGVIGASQRYTMENERAIHASLIEEATAIHSSGFMPENSAGDINADIVLFEEEEIITEESMNAESNDETQCPTQSETNESPDKNSEFDDNIELF